MILEEEDSFYYDKHVLTEIAKINEPFFVRKSFNLEDTQMVLKNKCCGK